MALKSTIFRADLQIADMERNYYHDHALTLARHPSETDERMMVRVYAFAMHANEALAFGQGIGNDEEPDLWQKDLTGAIENWIEVGLPDEKRVRRACGRALVAHDTGWLVEQRDQHQTQFGRGHHLHNLHRGRALGHLHGHKAYCGCVPTA